MSVKSWADAARSAAFRQNNDSQRALNVFEQFFVGESTSEACAYSIDAIYRPLLQADPQGSQLAAFWGIFCDAVKEFGNDQALLERLISLLDSIAQLPEVYDNSGNALKSAWGGTYWSALPFFPMMFREYAMDIDAEDHTEGDWYDQATPLFNATCFAARYLNQVKDVKGMVFHAEGSMRNGPEAPYQTKEQKYRARMYIPPAAIWILLAGKKLYQLCKDDYERNDHPSSFQLSNDDLGWKGGSGLCIERWKFWKQKFSTIARMEDVGSAVREKAERATAEMERIENEEQL